MAVALFHAALGYALVNGLNLEFVQRPGDNLKVFDVALPPPPPPREEKPAEQAPEGEASPPNLKAPPAPIVAPPPEIHLEVPPPVVTTPSRGAADVVGPGSGSGGVGTGTGSGGEGTGPGGGGGSRAARIAGRLANEDYPRSALRARAEGTVSVRYTVQTDGSVDDCRVIRSSGNAALDSTTCRLIERRFRYRPATDAQGRPTQQDVTRTFDWLIPLGR